MPGIYVQEFEQSYAHGCDSEVCREAMQKGRYSIARINFDDLPSKWNLMCFRRGDIILEVFREADVDEADVVYERKEADDSQSTLKIMEGHRTELEFCQVC
jgi:hypothetical protein